MNIINIKTKLQLMLLKKLLHREIKDKIMLEDELILFDTSISSIDKGHWGYNFITVEDLFNISKSKYLKSHDDYAALSKSIYQFLFGLIKTFNFKDIKVEIIDKDEVFKSVLYKEKYEIYKNCNEILKITKIL